MSRARGRHIAERIRERRLAAARPADPARTRLSIGPLAHAGGFTGRTPSARRSGTATA